MPREITIEWSTPSGTDHVSVLNFDPIVPVAQQRQAIDDALAGVVGALDNTTSYVVSTAGREWNDATGALEGAWTESTVQAAAGTVSGQPVPDSAQILVQWDTGFVQNGRFLTGRTYIPGCSTLNIDDGNLETTIRAALATAMQGLIDDDVAFGVWHRPTSGSGGNFVLATTASIWEEFAVLRRRR